MNLESDGVNLEAQILDKYQILNISMMHKYYFQEGSELGKLIFVHHIMQISHPSEIGKSTCSPANQDISVFIDVSGTTSTLWTVLLPITASGAKVWQLTAVAAAAALGAAAGIAADCRNALILCCSVVFECCKDVPQQPWQKL